MEAIHQTGHLPQERAHALSARAVSKNYGRIISDSLKITQAYWNWTIQGIFDQQARVKLKRELDHDGYHKVGRAILLTFQSVQLFDKATFNWASTIFGNLGLRTPDQWLEQYLNMDPHFMLAIRLSSYALSLHYSRYCDAIEAGNFEEAKAVAGYQIFQKLHENMGWRIAAQERALRIQAQQQEIAQSIAR